MTDATVTSASPNIMRFVRANIRDYALLISLLAIMVFFQFTTGGILFTPLNMTNIILQNSYIVIMALGMLLIIVAGHIDLSVGFLSGFVGAIAGVMMVTWKFDTFTSVAVCLAFGTLIGMLQGYFVAFFRIPAFIVTLAGMLIFRGLMIAMLSGRNLGPFPESFQALSNGYVPDFLAFMAPQGFNLFAMVVGAVVTGLILWSNWRSRQLEQAHGMAEEPIELFYIRNALIAAAFLGFSWIMASHRGLPNVLITMFALVALFMFITTRTTFGRRVYAMGGNEKAAKLSGIRTERVTVMIFGIMGALAALAGLVYAARLNSAQPKAGQGLELDVIAACFIGGAAVTGGVGKVTGVVIGAFIMGVMNNGMGIMGVGIDWQQVIKGAVLMLAVFLDVYYKNKAV
ncbi:MAG: sugar ABC transporter permease [Alphaproteobacteria bacterium]|jgi:putative multiple sugar transport system permease protein|nr:sugar ABC transporter permease [Alphaproteobacteria bacterium]